MVYSEEKGVLTIKTKSKFLHSRPASPVAFLDPGVYPVSRIPDFMSNIFYIQYWMPQRRVRVYASRL